jgi:hypothetical protein
MSVLSIYPSLMLMYEELEKLDLMSYVYRILSGSPRAITRGELNLITTLRAESPSHSAQTYAAKNTTFRVSNSFSNNQQILSGAPRCLRCLSSDERDDKKRLAIRLGQIFGLVERSLGDWEMLATHLDLIYDNRYSLDARHPLRRKLAQEPETAFRYILAITQCADHVSFRVLNQKGNNVWSEISKHKTFSSNREQPGWPLQSDTVSGSRSKLSFSSPHLYNKVDENTMIYLKYFAKSAEYFKSRTDVITATVNLPDQFWNTLWPDLVRMDEELAKLGVNPEASNT